MHIRFRGAALGLVLAATGAGLAVAQQVPADIWPLKGDIPENFTPPTAARDDFKPEGMITMRDGVKPNNVIVSPKSVTNASIDLRRTPYNAAGRGSRMASPSKLSTPTRADHTFVHDGQLPPQQEA